MNIVRATSYFMSLKILSKQDCQLSQTIDKMKHVISVFLGTRLVVSNSILLSPKAWSKTREKETASSLRFLNKITIVVHADHEWYHTHQCIWYSQYFPLICRNWCMGHYCPENKPTKDPWFSWTFLSIPKSISFQPIILTVFASCFKYMQNLR